MTTNTRKTPIYRNWLTQNLIQNRMAKSTLSKPDTATAESRCTRPNPWALTLVVLLAVGAPLLTPSGTAQAVPRPPDRCNPLNAGDIATAHAIEASDCYQSYQQGQRWELQASEDRTRSSGQPPTTWGSQAAAAACRQGLATENPPDRDAFARGCTEIVVDLGVLQ
jgi:hypothetical protein